VSEITGSASEATWDQLARVAGGAADAGGESEILRQLLTFEVGGTPYAVPVENVREIVRIRPITPVPRVTSHVRGVISLRGEIIQVVDLRLRLGLPAIETSRSTRIIVAHTEDRVAGLLVDAVTEVLRVKEETIGPVGGGEGGAVAALCARGDDFVSMIDLDRVLDVDAAA
jgi:purine-binding chemotaxis protein CheW